MKRDVAGVRDVTVEWSNVRWLKPLVGVAVAAGVAVGFYLLRKNTQKSDTLESTATGEELPMGQTESVTVASTQSAGYQKVPTEESGEIHPSCHITVNPQADEQFQLSTGCHAEVDSDAPVALPHKFKKVVCRSRTEEDADAKGAALADKPTAAEETAARRVHMGNFPKTVSLVSKGFSSEDFQKTLLETLNNLYSHNRPISPTEARSLTLILEQKGPDVESGMLLKALVAIANLAAFTSNQELLREAGVMDKLIELLGVNLEESTSVMLLQALANMALNRGNQACSKRRVLPLLVVFFCRSQCSELEKLTGLRALLNYTTEIDSNDVNDLLPLIPALYSRISHPAQQADENFLLILRVLVNLSCSSHLTLYLLAAEAPADFMTLLDISRSAETVLLRSVSFVNNLCSAVVSMHLSDRDLPIEGKAAAPFTVFALLYGLEKAVEFGNRLTALCSHPNEEVRLKAEQIQRAVEVVRNWG